MSLGNGGRIERGVCGFTTLGSLSGLGGLDGGLRPRLFLAALRHLLPDAVEDRTAGGVSGRMPCGARGGFGAGLRDDGGAFVLVDVVRRLASCDRLFVANLSADAENVGHGLTEAFGGDLGVVEDAGVFVGRHSPEVFGAGDAHDDAAVMLEFARGRKDGLVEDHVGGRQHEDLGIDEMALDEERGVGRIADDGRTMLVGVDDRGGRVAHHEAGEVDAAGLEPRQEREYDLVDARDEHVPLDGLGLDGGERRDAFGHARKERTAGDEEVPHVRDGSEHQRIERDRQNRGCHDDAHRARRRDPERNALAAENEGEFTELRDAGTHDEGRVERPAQKQHERGRHAARDAHDDEHHGDHGPGFVHEDVRVEHEAHGDEEQHRKRVLQRQAVAGRTVRKARLAHHHACEEGAQSVAHVEDRTRAVGDPDGDRKHAEREELAGTRERHALENPREETLADDEHAGHEYRDAEQRLGERDDDEPRINGPLALRHLRDERQAHHDEDGDEVLHDEPADGDLTARRDGKLAKLKGLHHDDGRCTGERHAEDDRIGKRPVPGKERDDRAGGARCGHLQHRARDGHALDLHEVGDREVQAHAEHQEHHADFGELLRDDAVDVGKEREEAHGHARDDVAHKRGGLQEALCKPPENKRKPEARHERGDDGKLIGQGRFSSGLSSLVRSSPFRCAGRALCTERKCLSLLFQRALRLSVVPKRLSGFESLKLQKPRRFDDIEFRPLSRSSRWRESCRSRCR